MHLTGLNIEMNYRVLLFILAITSMQLSMAQVQVKIEGAIQLANTIVNPNPGTIRWTGSDFQGWNGHAWVSLSSNKVVGSVTDIDGNEYPTMRIGKSEWMLENLKVSKYNDGAFLPQITLNETWTVLTGGAWCWYNNDPAMESVHGKLYNQFAIKTDKICPVGWRVPSKDDWKDLFDDLGGIDKAAGVMKKVQSGLWNNAVVGNNDSGFGALPSGMRHGADGSFRNRSSSAHWWAYETGVVYNMHYSSLGLTGQILNEIFGFSIRCIR